MAGFQEVLERIAPARRPAEPDAGRLFQLCANPAGVDQAGMFIDMTVQRDIGRPAQRFEIAGERASEALATQ